MFEVFEVADLHRAQGMSASTSARAGATAATISAPMPVRKRAKPISMIGVERQRDAREAGHEMGIHHRVLQLRALALDLLRHRLAGELRQRRA